jgi:hypothetical protein
MQSAPTRMLPAPTRMLPAPERFSLLLRPSNFRPS